MSIHATAIIDPTAEIEPTAEIGPYVVIDRGARIGSDCRIAAFVHILGNTEIAANCRIHTGVVIGDTPQDKSYEGGESFCRIGAGTTLREGVTVHRGTTPGSVTQIGAGCLIMCNAHVGHNCEIQDNVTLVNGALLGGYVRVGPSAIISGNAAVHQHVRIGELCIVGGLAKVTQDVPPFVTFVHNLGCAGINLIGMRRNGLNAMERSDARNAYKTLYRSGLGLKSAIEALERTAETRSGRSILEFLQGPSLRGLSSASGKLMAAHADSSSANSN